MILKIKSPSWLPPELKRRLKQDGEIVCNFSMSRAEKKILRKQKPILPSVWAEKNRILTMSDLPGKWHNSVCPYSVGVVDGIDFPSVREAYICFPPQSGKSEMVHNYAGYVMDMKPMPIMYCYPDKTLAQENSKDRILPMIKSSPRLREFLTGAQDDEASYRISLQHLPIYLAWSGSVSSQSNKPAGLAICDEVDKNSKNIEKKETSSTNLMRKRLITYKRRSKFIMLSTPTIEEGEIWQAMEKAEAVFDYWVKCPDCKTLHDMKFEGIKWPKEERDPERMETKNLAWYECPHCPSVWDDEKRNEAARGGEWRERKTTLELFRYLELHRPRKIGYQLRSWVSRFVSLSEAAAAFLSGLKSKNDLKDFHNAHMAEPWVPFGSERKEEAIIALADDRVPGTVPGGGIIAALTAGVDTMKNFFTYEIRAWAYGTEKTSWQIRAGDVIGFENLDKIIRQDVYLDPDGNEYKVRLAVMDAMGEKTKEVYDFCRTRRGLFIPFKGEQRLSTPTSRTKLDVYPGTTLKIPGGLELLRADVNLYKNELSNRLNIAPADPGAWIMASNVTASWAQQMIAEAINDKTGFWEQISQRANHAWDCSVYNLVAYDTYGVQFIPDPAKMLPPPQPQQQQRQRKQKKDNWLDNKNNDNWFG